MILNWKVSREEHLLIAAIVKRYAALLPEVDHLELNMDITATHANGCPLKLQELLEAPEFDFVHDVVGIRRHINRQTGQLEDFFLPRYAVPNPQGVTDIRAEKV